MDEQAIPDRGFGTLVRRFAIDILVVLSTVALVIILADVREHDRERAEAVSTTRAAVRMLQAEVDLQNAMVEEALVGEKFPPAISPAWFEGQRPANAFAASDLRWVDVAEEDERSLRHPRQPTMDGKRRAMFWYNPALGIVRARVPRLLSDSDTMRLYNEVNDTSLGELLTTAMEEDRD